MHPHLVAISNLWQADVACDRLRIEHEGLNAAVVKATSTLTNATAARDSAVSARDAVKQEDRKNGRELDDYVKKRNTTRAMIEGGTSPDYEASVRQLAQVLEIVDRLETRGLELIESLEAAEAAVVATNKALVAATAALADARKALALRDGPIRTELGAALLVRAEMAKHIDEDYRIPYGELRRKKRVALVNVADGICTTCHSMVTAQRINEVVIGKAVNTCPGCGGYLLP